MRLAHPCLHGALQRSVQPKAVVKTAAFGWLALMGLLFILGGCSSATAIGGTAGTPTPNITLTFAAALSKAATEFPTTTPTPTVTPVPPTPTPTATPRHTPSPLPPLFTSSVLAKDVTPQTYIKDTCQYLKARWDPNNSAPGTVVMVIMYHSVTEDYNTLLPDGSQVHNSDLVRTFEHAQEVGFQTINTRQLADFLDHNAKIPRRSLLVIVDDRKRQEYYEKHFFPFLEKFNWTITNAWISAKDTPDYLYKENQAVYNTGLVDVQAHGVVHNIPINDFSKDDFILGELKGSIEAIQKHFGKTPIGYIWPGGGFSKRAVELAREAGYRVGFTTNPRGPLMFNWIPQAAQADPNHPFWLPEIPAGDPLLTLPRYWSSDAAYRIDDVIAIGDEAIAAAEQSKAAELDYYNVMCAPQLGPIPTAVP